MLVLSRNIRESVVISGPCVVTVVEIRGNKIRLGIEAERSVSIHRQEVYEAIQSAHARADGSQPIVSAKT